MKFWEFKNSASASETKEATLYVYGDILTYDLDDWNFPDDVVPNKFKNELNALGDVDTIHVRINSSGGSVTAAFAIMNLLKEHKAKVICHIDGIAASAATLIAMAGDKIIAALGSIIMVHLPLTWVFGNVNDFQKAIDVLNTITEGMVDVYHAKTGIDKTEIRALLDKDDWMTGQQALEKKFVDEVADFEVAAYLSDDKTTAFFNDVAVPLKKTRNKDGLVAMLPQRPQNKPTTTEITNQSKKEDEVMNLADLQAKHPALYTEVLNMGIAQGASSDAITKAKEEGRMEGITAERERIKKIDARILPGLEALANKAKFETGISAADYALEVLEAQKQKGISFMNAAEADAKELEDVPAAGAPQDDTAEEDALLAHAKEAAKNITRRV